MVLSARVRLVLASALMLFVELALIRWTSSNNLYLVHLTNFVLLASFLGIGLGFLSVGRGRDLFPLAPVLLATLVGFVLAFPVRTGTTTSGGWALVGTFGTGPLPRWLSLTVIFLLTVAALGTVAQEVARTFAAVRAAGGLPPRHRRLPRWGSRRSPACRSCGCRRWRGRCCRPWCSSPCLGDRVRWRHWLPAVGVGAVVVLLGARVGRRPFQWSPYYKIRTETAAGGNVRIDVNNTPLQTTASVEQISKDSPFYLYPYTYAGARGEVLVVGAGTGNDVAVALSKGARRVDAVEIDPALVQIGRDRHPDRPYSDPRVTVHVDDGRAFMERTSRRYDLVLLRPARLGDHRHRPVGAAPRELPVHDPGPGAGPLAAHARRHVRDVQLLRAVAARPLRQHDPHGLRHRAVRAARADARPAAAGGALAARRRLDRRLHDHVDAAGRRARAVRRRPPVPLPRDAHDPVVLPRGCSALVLLVSLALVRVVGGPLRQMAPYTDLFFMGVAFLLLETKNVVQFALLFGTTWAVNAAVFTGVLLSVLAAVEVARRVRVPRPVWLYVALLAALALAWGVPGDLLLNLSPVPRFVAGVTIAFLPIFLANLLFAVRFKGVASSTTAFAANLLGAMVGGALEYLALILGFNALLVVVALCYGAALLAGRRHLVPAPVSVGAQQAG